jgi:hypothetical protein
MTSKDRREIIERLLALWEEFPDLRLGQLIGNYFLKDTWTLYYVHDEYLISELERRYHNVAPVPGKGEILVGHSIIRPIKGLSRHEKEDE